MFNKKILTNGLRLLTVPMPQTKSITVLVLVGAGSRYETKEINGLSHFLEHLFFKGTKKRPSAFEISKVIDGIGAEFNAFTSKDHTGFYVKCASQHLELALDVLSDMLLNSKFDKREIEMEKGVIIEEINLYEDTPIKKISDVFEGLLYGDQPLGWQIIGSKENIRKVKRNDFLSYLDNLYRCQNFVLSLSGDESKIQNSQTLVNQYFRNLATGKPKTTHLAVFEQQCQPMVKLQYKKTDQAHLCLGVRGYPINHPDRYILAVLATILGGGMSSRLFIQVRERRGLAYYVRSAVEHYKDAGYFVTQAGVDLNKIEEAIKVILQEYVKITNPTSSRQGGTTLGAGELKKAKECIKGKLTLELEDSRAQAGFYASQELLEEKIETPEEIMRKVDQVTAEDIKRVAKDIFVNQKLNLAIIGPFDREEKFTKILKL